MGQSLGAAVAVHAFTTTTTAKSPFSSPSKTKENGIGQGKTSDLRIEALILETPFLSIPHMLTAIYPQPYLPYRYLSPFLRSHWDSAAALRKLSYEQRELEQERSEPEPCEPSTKLQPASASTNQSRAWPKVLILQAGQDELVPKSHGEELEGVCEGLGMGAERVVVRGALHAGCMSRAKGREAVVGVVRGVGEGRGFSTLQTSHPRSP